MERQFEINSKWIENVQMGPFRYLFDKGVDLRRVVIDCVLSSFQKRDAVNVSSLGFSEMELKNMLIKALSDASVDIKLHVLAEKTRIHEILINCIEMRDELANAVRNVKNSASIKENAMRTDVESHHKIMAAIESFLEGF